MDFKIILGILLAGILSNNYAFLHFLGTGAVIENERPTKKSFFLGLGTTMVMVLCTLITWPIDKYLLESVPYLQTMAFVVVLLIIVEIMNIVGKKTLNNYCHADFIKFAINGAVLGLCIECCELMFVEALVNAFAIGIGFTLSMIVFAKLKDVPVDEDAIPPSFRGLPIALLTAGMIVLAIVALDFPSLISIL